MTVLDSMLKSKDRVLLTKFYMVKAMAFPVDMYGCENWAIKKAEHQRNDAFKLWYGRRLLRVPWTSRRSNHSILKGINPEYSLEGLMWSWSTNTLVTWCEEITYWIRPSCWERQRAGGEGVTEDEMVGWHHRLDGHECEQTLGDSEGQGSLVCCNLWGLEESDMTEWLNYIDKTEIHWLLLRSMLLKE